jgi:hypothetical protein
MPDRPQNNRSFQRYHELCGALHLHTVFSDGGVGYPVMIDSAKAVGLDYIVVTDHMSLRGIEEGFEGFSGGLFVCIGYEHNDSNNLNHYLAIGSRRIAERCVEPQQYIDEIQKQGGIGFLAHPVEKRHYFKKYPPYPWTRWDVSRFDGIELWNQMSDWLENLKSWLYFMRLFYPRRFLVEIQRELLEKWDSLNRERFVGGIGGVDAHTMKVRIGLFRRTIFPIKVELKGIRTHLYIEQPLPKTDTAAAKSILMETLKKGNGFISNYRRDDARGTKIYIEDSTGGCFAPGMRANDLKLPACIRTELTDSACIRLVRNGRYEASREGTSAAFDITSPGLYRVEVYKKKFAWIYSNPFPVGRYPLW